MDQLLEKFHFIGLNEKFSKDKLFEYFSNKKISKNEIYTLSNKIKSPSKSILIQKVIKTPFVFEYALLSNENHSSMSIMKRNYLKIMGKKLTNEFKKKEKEFQAKFQETFQLNTHIDFGTSALSNLIGGIGFFSGSSIHQYEGKEPIYTSPNNVLFCTTPSRSFFPRGFLWDEGFHQLLIQKYDKEIYQDIISHWLNMMDSNGWIAREQILGDEARSKVPPEFQKQSDSHANPPTLFLSLLNIVENLKSIQIKKNSEFQQEQKNSTEILSNEEEHLKDVQFLQKIYPQLEKYYHWFFKTQTGSIKDSFRWRGRSKGHTFTSGLDDYPRGSPSPVLSERHLDLYCWMYMISDIMNQICDVIQVKNHHYLQNQNTLSIKLDELHLNKELGIHSDYVGVNYGKKKREYSNHLGYISMFPLISEMISIESDKFDKLLNLINNPKHLYSSYGIRSLSISDKLFGTKENCKFLFYF
jgi:mannosyl-oligosaccharide glucosidase